MYTYEFVTPSDPITFKASDDKIAYAAAIILGNGKAGANRYENGEKVNLGTMLMFCENAMEVIEEELGRPLEQFLELNKLAIADCLESFSYGDLEDRKTFDDAIEAITDPIKLKEFKAKHEDRNRSSMSQWVKGAWNLGKTLRNKHAAKA